MNQRHTEYKRWKIGENSKLDAVSRLVAAPRPANFKSMLIHTAYVMVNIIFGGLDIIKNINI